MTPSTLRLAAAALTLCLLTGCPKAYEITMAPQQTSTDSFVIVQYTKSGSMKIWDCREVPEGKAWNPTCVRVEMKNSVREDPPDDGEK
jgi:hypothetical protein